MASACPFHSKLAVTPPRSTFSLEEELAFLAEAHAGDQQKATSRQAVIRAALMRGEAAPLTTGELTWAGRIAWRNHARCIGRLHWRGLIVRDHRDIDGARGIFEALVSHLDHATNGGQIRSVMTVFAPSEKNRRGPRIWNAQLCSYAGYRDAQGDILGDPRNVDLTERALALGWEPPQHRSAFDLLPWIIEGAGEAPRLFPLPRESVLEVALTHPELPWFGKLGLKWYAVPVITDMALHAAGTDFSAAPFNGWYMGTEIGARNLSDENRYNQLPVIARHLGLDITTPRSLWKDRALLELNTAVLHSFAEAGVRMVDHHTASKEFLRFCEREAARDRAVSARWDWIVPPLSPATTGVFHTPMTEIPATPDFHHLTTA